MERERGRERKTGQIDLQSCNLQRKTLKPKKSQKPPVNRQKVSSFDWAWLLETEDVKLGLGEDKELHLPPILPPLAIQDVKF